MLWHIYIYIYIKIERKEIIHSEKYKTRTYKQAYKERKQKDIKPQNKVKQLYLKGIFTQNILFYMT